jgi:hypothetical protein
MMTTMKINDASSTNKFIPNGRLPEIYKYL